MTSAAVNSSPASHVCFARRSSKTLNACSKLRRANLALGSSREIPDRRTVEYPTSAGWKYPLAKSRAGGVLHGPPIGHPPRRSEREIRPPHFRAAVKGLGRPPGEAYMAAGGGVSSGLCHERAL
ncbi:hypothetical protein CDV58_08531, partial [Aspergillus fumigatus]